MAANDVLEARRLAARRGFATLFVDVDFSLHDGEALVVTGPNGSGKTTLLRIVAGLTAPAAGEVRWRGEATRPFDPRLRGVVAFNGHWSALKDELTAEENLDAWTSLTDQRVTRDAIVSALDDVALSRQRRLPVRVLSQGQRRRIALARLALAKRALWILDEPLTALDDQAVDVLADLLDAHLSRGGVCVAASHQPMPIAATRAKTLALC
ncbi:MAG TPA: cytochrome c biogenesis heme-transporting ATPase CcmA [Casimicrobiaceae bacterium]|nr:cytochrome c biogenesis heme-transporting ATPase CcmA [Casimicrobiaceae bacterium]